jgi:hypothetical protein
VQAAGGALSTSLSPVLPDAHAMPTLQSIFIKFSVRTFCMCIIIETIGNIPQQLCIYAQYGEIDESDEIDKRHAGLG